ncbi:MAG: TetR/AcrR family transcriptional regulator, partial [Gemmobacter sp.]
MSPQTLHNDTTWFRYGTILESVKLTLRGPEWITGGMRVLTEKKRAAIVAAAGRMFAQHGYGGTTMTHIASEAGASKATLYRYFNEKSEVF